MDSQIYLLLASADQEKNVNYIRQAFEILDPNMSTGNEKSANDVENFSQNLYVECAEKAINYEEFSIAHRCVQIYFSLPMIANQFLARAYLCQFELMAPRGTHQLESVEKSVPFLFKAIDYSKENKRYNFLIYNSSIIFWKYARVFMKPNFKKYLCVSLLKIIQALRDIEDPDYEWRVFLEKTLIEAYIDNNQHEEASTLANELLKFVEHKHSSYYEELFEFMITHSLINKDEITLLTPTRWELQAIYRMVNLKNTKNPIIENKAPPASVTSTKAEEVQTDSRYIMNELEEIYKLALPANIAMSQLSNNQFLKASSEDFLITFKRQRIMLNLAKVCLHFEEVNICSQILGYLKETELVNEELALELEFLECVQIIKGLKHRKEKYSKNIVKIRVDCITKLNDALRNSLRLNNPRLVQQGCETLWNLCLPLLQPGVRKQVRKSLQLIVESLSTIDSMEWLLRSQVHFELAKCDEEIEQLQTAEFHLLKAMEFDDHGVYTDQLSHSLRRLRLRAELYVTPEHIEDQVGMILEQCVVGGKSEKKIKPAISELVSALDSKNKTISGEINTHSLLLRAALLLAPDEYNHVLESEIFRSNFGKLNEDQVSKLAKKAANYQHCIIKGSEHLNEHMSDIERDFQRRSDLSSEPLDLKEVEAALERDYKVRLKLWLDLCRIARKQQIWDICRVSCRFLILYDREDLINRFLKKRSLYDIELMRNLAEAHFILGEALVQYLRNEGINLFEKPEVPDLTDNLKAVIKRNNNTNDSEKSLNLSRQSKMTDVNKRDFKTDQEWLDYCEWLDKMSKETMDHFIRGVQIGVELNEAWLVCQGSAYAWNYLHHIFENKNYNKVVSILTTLLDSLKKTGHNCEPELLVAICVALVHGLIEPWLPAEQVKPLQIPNLELETSSDQKPRKSAAKKSTAATTVAAKGFTVPNEALADFKKALEICDYAMNITNGDNPADVVSLRDRFTLIKTWVLCKQINQSAIKSYGIMKPHPEGLERHQDKFTKCMVAIEILNKNQKLPGGLASYEIKDSLSLKELISFIDQAYSWPDRLIELELWTNIAVLANKAGQTESLRYAHSKALESISYFEKNKKSENKTIYTTSQSLLSTACIACGEHLANLINSSKSSSSNSKDKGPTTSQTSVSKLGHQQSQRDHSSTTTIMSVASTNRDTRVGLRRDALNAFSDACGHAALAESYELAIHAARHYWNLCMPYLQQSEERATLHENLQEILQSLQIVYKFKPKEVVKTDEDSEVGEDGKKGDESKKDMPHPETSISKKPGSEMKSNTATNSKKTPSAVPSKMDKIDESRNSQNQTISENLLDSTIGVEEQEKPFDPFEDRFDDLTLRCVLYACHFQVLIDRQDFEEALEQMEMALNDLPRTKHRLLIYRIKVITKSKLGLDVQMDLQKFKEESEKNLAQMYRKVALSSLKHCDTINSYQRAIEGLSLESSIWLKIEYILEFAQWLYSNEYNHSNCIDLVEWVIDILMFKVKGEKLVRASSASTTQSRSGKTSKMKQRATKPTNPLIIVPESINEDDAERVIVDNLNTEMNAIENKESFEENNFFDTPINKHMSWNDIQDIKQLEGLTRAHIVLAMMMGKASSEYNGHLLKAYYSLYRLIWQAVENGLYSSKEISKMNNNTEANTAVDKKKSNAPPDGKKTAGGKSKNIKLEAGASGYLPQTLEQWCQFEITEDIYNAWSHESMKKIGINRSTIIEPYLLFYYLDALGRMLSEQGYSNLLFPVYHLQLIIINSVLKFDIENAQFISLISYIRLRLISLCVEMNCIQAVAHHQQILTDLIAPTDPSNPMTTNTNPSNLLKLLQIDPLEACIVREQIYLQKQRVSHMQDEEAILQAQSALSFTVSNSKMGSPVKSKLKKNQRTAKIRIADGSSKKWKQTKIQDIKLPGENRAIHSSMHDMLYQDIWIELAEALIENGFFQTARDFLFESLNACKTFDEKYTSAKIQYLLSKLALFDCNFLEARNHASNAQKIAIDEMFWFKCICVLVDSHKFDYQDKQAYEKCTQILHKSLRLVKAEKGKRANKRVVFEYMEAMFDYELAQITMDGLLTGKVNDGDLTRQQKMGRRTLKQNTLHPNLFKKLMEVCEMYEKSYTNLLANQFRREAVQVIRSHARLLQGFASDCNNLESKQNYFLKSLDLLNEALNISNEIWIETEGMQQMQDIQSVSLPVQRELVDVKLEITQLMTEMLELNLNKIKTKNNMSLRQDNISKTLENFINTPETRSETELKWCEFSSQLPDLILSHLTSCHNLSYKIKQFRAQTLFLIGRTFRIISELKIQTRKADLNDVGNMSFSLPISKWSPLIMEIIRTQQILEAENSSKMKGTKSQLQKSSMATQSYLLQSDTVNNDPDANLNENSDIVGAMENSSLHLILEQENFKNLLVSINQTEAQSMECLFQALNLSFSNDNKSLTRDIAYELIELIGRFDLQLCTQFIALYQSCSNALDIEQVVEKSSLDPKNSLLISYLHQQKFFQTKAVTQNLINSPLIKQINDLTKSKFIAFKYLNPTLNHFNLSKDLPPNYLVFIMQHNRNKTELYGTLLDKTPANQGKVSRATMQNNPSIMNIGGSKTTAIKIKTDPFELHHLQQQWKEWKSSLQSFNLKIEFQLNNDLIQRNSNFSQNKSSLYNISELMKIYLNSNNPKFDEMLQTLMEIEQKFEFLINKTEAYLHPITEFFEKYFYVPVQSGDGTQPVKAVDKVIICADLDLLEFPLESMKIIHNNFSISSISRDFSIQFLSTRINLNKECEMNSSGDKKDNKKPDTKADKKPNTSESLPDGAISIDHSKFKYLVDAFNEASNGLPEEYIPINNFKKIIQSYSQFAGKWNGLTGSDHIASAGERERMLMEANCFVFNGTERFLSYFNSSKISSINLNECRLLISNDLANTSQSYSRLGKLDVFRNSDELECESPLEANILLSLAGVKSIMSNQWNSTLAENSEKLSYIMKEFMENRHSCGEIVRYRMSPHIKKIFTDYTKKELEKNTALEANKNNKGKKEEVKETKTPTKQSKSSEDVLEINENDDETKKAEEELKQKEFMKSLERLRKENLNMILYGIPDVYLVH